MLLALLEFLDNLPDWMVSWPFIIAIVYSVRANLVACFTTSSSDRACKSPGSAL